MSRPTQSSERNALPAASARSPLQRCAVIALLGSACIHRTARAAMRGTMMDFEALMRQARILVDDSILVDDKVPEQSRQSLPIPAKLAKGLHIGFMFAPSQALPGVNRLAPPHWVAWLVPSTATLAALQPVMPASFGQNHHPDQMIGEFRLPPGMSAADYLAERHKLFDLYATLVAAWDRSMPPRQPGLQAPAAEFLRLFGLLAEGPLIVYYYKLGGPFFDWTRAAATIPCGGRAHGGCFRLSIPKAEYAPHALVAIE